MPDTVKTNWPPVSRPPGMVLDDSWNGLVKGDQVRIIGDQSGQYSFQHHTRYPNGSEGVVLYGGVGNHRQYREVGCDAITKGKPGKRKGSAVVHGPPTSPAEATGDAMPGVPSKPPQASPEPAAGIRPVDDLKAAREALGLSRRVLADKAGVSQATLDKVERGQPTRDADAEAKVRAALGEA